MWLCAIFIFPWHSLIVVFLFRLCHMLRGTGRSLLSLSRKFVSPLIGRSEISACGLYPLPVTWGHRLQLRTAVVKCYFQPPPECLSLTLPTNPSQQPDMADFPFCVDYDKRGMAKCKKCKQKCDKGVQPSILFNCIINFYIIFVLGLWDEFHFFSDIHLVW